MTYHKFKVLSQSWRNRMMETHPYCWYCGAKPGSDTSAILTLDHLVAVSRGGPTNSTNLILCCSACNNKRGDGTQRFHGFPFKELASAYIEILNPRRGGRPTDEEFERCVQLARVSWYVNRILGRGANQISHKPVGGKLSQYVRDMIWAKQEWWDLQKKHGLPERVRVTPIRSGKFEERVAWPHGGFIKDLVKDWSWIKQTNGKAQPISPECVNA